MTPEMQREFYRYFCRRYDLVGINLVLSWIGGEMDIIGVRKSGFIDEIEIKRSVSDFNADFKKIVITNSTGRYMPSTSDRMKGRVFKHDAIKSGEHACNYFSFYLPEELVEKVEIPDYAGLYVFKANAYWKVQEVKKAPRLHTRRIGSHQKQSLSQKTHDKLWRMVLAAKARK